jgi:high affinity Mn2+ porin
MLIARLLEKTTTRSMRVLMLCLCVTLSAWAQDPTQQTPAPAPATAPAADQPVTPERWNLFYQATSIGQYHGTFYSPYSGPFSLQDYPERDVSLTTTLFFAFRPWQNTLFVFDPEIAGGRGFSGVNGLANSSNGELPRVATATPKPYIARLFLAHDFGWGSEKESVESDENQLAGERPVDRYTVTVGRFTLTDFFDDNRYTHDPRMQFMGWGVMYNGAWDYPADVRGYDWGIVQELHTRNWSFRYGIAAEPRVANGSQFDRRLFRDHGQTFEEERRYSLRAHAGAVRVLEYDNRADAGNYAEALKLADATGTAPSVAATRRPGTLKYGLGISMDQEITKEIGIFARLGWNDGKTESFAFTAIDRLVTGGVSLGGQRWHRQFDTVATEITACGLSGAHASYLAHGGYDFLIGDGRLEYGPETTWESYYSARLFPGFFASLDFQHVNNPAYNEDRGPVRIYSLRLHMEFGKNTFSKSDKH